MPSSQGLSRRLALASVGTALAVGIVCAVGLFSLGDAAAVAHVAVTRQLQLADDATAMGAFLYQKGFVAEYLLTGDREWLAELETSRPAFESWLVHAHDKLGGDEARKLLDDVQAEYVSFDAIRKRAISLFDDGRLDDAKVALGTNRPHAQRLRSLFDQLGRLARADAERKLAASERAVRHLAHILVATSVAGAAASLLVGFLWARRVTKPIYELQVQVESAAERTRITVGPGRAGLDAMGDQVNALVEKLEQTDAALAEHRRRLVQSEKLSAVGELAAKLAHEVLNPLAGIKAAVQVLARQRSAAGDGASVSEVVEAVSREITRVDGLLRRLMRFARPLAPRVQIVTVASILDGGVAAARPALARANVTVDRRAPPELPPVEADPQLLAQVLTNLLTNAADAMAPHGGPVTVEAGRAMNLGRDEIFIRVTDGGPGISDATLGELFKPFFTTKPEGHGLGLAVSQNILLEHGGRIAGRNRPVEEGAGAIFELAFPVVR
ncbi:MAG TPA: ATP-binding protein [Polyangia bacterium]|jgi:C4-dicarboxylate-specific signal transduction histidine kinase